MLQVGQFHTLTAVDRQPQGLYLDDGDSGTILLPNRQIPEGTQIGDALKVFIYLDSDDRIIATCQRPKVQLHQVAWLQTVDVNNTGAFLDWGLPKDLFVPFAEQQQRMEVGRNYAVYLTEDNTGRLIGSARLNRYIKDHISSTEDTVWQHSQIQSQANELKNGDAVKLLVVQSTDLGFKAVVNHRWWGVLHQSDIRTAIRPGQKLDGYIKRIRDDGKLDVSLEPPGHRRALPLASRIMKKLEASGGRLGLSDRSPAELIEMHFGVSKRVFKMAIGQLYKERKIIIEADAITLVDPSKISYRKPTKPGQRTQQKHPQKTNKPQSKRTAQPDAPHTSKSRTGTTAEAKNSRSTNADSAADNAIDNKPANRKIWKNNRPKTSRTLGLKKD